jgi:hypothetical protein
MDGPVEELQCRPLGFWVKIEPARPGEDRPRLGGILREVGEDVLPAVVRGDVLDEKNGLGDGLIELAGVDLELDLGQD